MPTFFCWAPDLTHYNSHTPFTFVLLSASNVVFSAPPPWMFFFAPSCVPNNTPFLMTDFVSFQHRSHGGTFTHFLIPGPGILPAPCYSLSPTLSYSMLRGQNFFIVLLCRSLLLRRGFGLNTPLYRDTYEFSLSAVPPEHPPFAFFPFDPPLLPPIPFFFQPFSNELTFELEYNTTVLSPFTYVVHLRPRFLPPFTQTVSPPSLFPPEYCCVFLEIQGYQCRLNT